ncbi:MAG: M14 metallopeptidase family protein [Sediminicola sp.]
MTYPYFQENKVRGRYVTNACLEPFYNSIQPFFTVTELGNSVAERPIKEIRMGSGPIKILMWSQMHGNESTTTKAVLDFVRFMESECTLSKALLSACTISIVPILNPDGAEAYTRVNANLVDLNRDAQERTQPESMVLRRLYDHFSPDFCFNLHDQRTIFNVGTTPLPATVSFLAPAHDEERNISSSRAISMKLIVAMDGLLQTLIPGQVGRYDDGFNSNCAGDAFQMLGTPTILFEAGHYPGDYGRERTREFVYYAILKAVDTIAKGELDTHKTERYFEIPENDKLFYDVLIRNSHLINASHAVGTDVGILYKEVLEDGDISFLPEVAKMGKLTEYLGHKVYNALDINDINSMKEHASLWSVLGSTLG